MSKLITIILGILVLASQIYMGSSTVYAQELPATNSTTIGTITVDILFPKVGKSRKFRPDISTKPVEVSVSDTISICLQIHPQSGKYIGEDGYKADYYMDNQLIHEQESVFESEGGKITYIFKLNLNDYTPGLHTLIVNLWDKHTAVGIGIKELNIKMQNAE